MTDERHGAGHHLAGGWIAENAREYCDVEAFQMRFEFVEHRQCSKCFVGDK